MITIFIPILSLFLYLLIDMFISLQKDEKAIHGEFISEYEKQVVKPLISASKRDAMVGSDGSVDFYLPLKNTKYDEKNLLTQRDALENSLINNNNNHRNEPIYSNYEAIQVYGTPVFPSSLGIANAIRRRSGMPEHELHYNIAGYYTSKPLDCLDSESEIIDTKQTPYYQFSARQSKLLRRIKQRHS
ncbi:uncharacterized protein SAPINGB_P006470 [Magnusiomyces paraingens]|uniref:Uncharacterized protein n=1 Tax=Magnusiomyces paraingens TaxID=2606893 RepID=A0A5E8C553_9ASCO|nr:uncharacterized protein SAPINGB_P006470 [Saprochaete ingens]VVT58959.1 unnamed protein product [Saprochaete ingens]